MNCDPLSLVEAAKCFTGIPLNMFGPIELAVLCQIASGGGGGGSPAKVFCYNVDPTVDPGVSCALAINTASGGLFYWDGSNWHQVIGGP